MAKSSQEVDSALAMLKEVQLLGYCDDDCKVLFGKLLNRKGEWSSALKHCSEVGYLFSCIRHQRVCRLSAKERIVMCSFV